MIDARSLHKWLAVEDRFNDWIRRRIKEYGFEEPADLLCYAQPRNKGQRGGWNRKDYLLTIDTAKELAMVERTERGRETRRYFIKMERAAQRYPQSFWGEGVRDEPTIGVFHRPPSF